MKVAVPKELQEGERRVALAPESCKKLIAKGISVVVESGAGANSFFSDQSYQAVGATVEPTRRALFQASDFLLTVQPPTPEDVASLRENTLLLGSLLPIKHLDTIQALAKRRITAFSTDCIPRTTRAQSMDTLSAMANIAGYKAVLMAANESAKYFPMFMTAAGTIHAAKVFVIGAGVAGLQAIATAKRLGATVSATDTRRVVAEQIQSVGGKFIGVESEEDAQTATGYAKELSADFYDKQAKLIGDQCALNDVVITTALIGGVKAPKLISADMVRRMQPGSVIVDLAAEAGGNCELTRPGQTVIENGVKIVGPLNVPSQMPRDASTLYSRNLAAFLLAFSKDGAFALDLNDEIQKGAVVTHDGKVTHEPAAKALAAR